MHLTEHITDWRTSNLEINLERRQVQNVALTGAASKNGYRYTESALQSAAGLYENKPVFLDHPRTPTKPHDRSARDLIGSIINSRYEHGRIRGDIQTLDTEAGRTFLALAQAGQPNVGMSHVVLADKTDQTVHTIHEVISVDAVVFPATTSTLHEQAACGEAVPSDDSQNQSTQGAAPGTLGAEANSAHSSSPQAPHLPLSNLKSQIPNSPPSVSQSLSPSASDPRSPSISPSLNLSIPPSARPASLELPPLEPGRAPRLAHAPPPPVPRAGASSLHNLLRQLPPKAITPLFEQQLKEAPNEHAQQALLEDRLTLLKQLNHNPPASPQRLQTQPTPNDETIIQTIRNH